MGDDVTAWGASYAPYSAPPAILSLGLGCQSTVEGEIITCLGGTSCHGVGIFFVLRQNFCFEIECRAKFRG